MSQRVLLVAAAVVALGLVLANHRSLILHAAAATMEVPELGPQTEEGIDAIWFDDYFTVFRIDPETYAIGETRYHQTNFNYLIAGTSRAVLFDSGPGLRDIVPVVRSLTSLPVTMACSHLHYDHVGQYGALDESAMIDLPELRERANDGSLALDSVEFMGFVEGRTEPVLEVDQWWTPGSEIDLGGRRLVVHHTPGHTPESMVLEDPERKQFFTGDTIYPGELYAFLPNSSLGDYARTTDRMLERMDSEARLFGAHRLDPVGLPELARSDLRELKDALARVREGSDEEEGFFPTRIQINDRLALLMDFGWGRRWE